MNNNMYIPFTYHICWPEHNLHYYGVKFAKGCHPDDLWNPYKTSSKVVKALLESIGEPDIIEERRRFTTKEEAIEWEVRVLKRLGVTKRDDWVNQSAGRARDNRGRPLSEEHKIKLSTILLGNQRAKGNKGKKYLPWTKKRKGKHSIIMEGNKNGLGFKHTNKSKEIISKGLLGNKNGKGNKGKMLGIPWSPARREAQLKRKTNLK